MYVIILCVGFRSIHFVWQIKKKIVGNVVKDILPNHGTNGTKAKNLAKRVHYINRMIFKETLEDIPSDDLKKDTK